MTENREEKEIRKLVRAEIQQVIESPEIQEEKRAFIDRHFEAEEAAFTFHPPFFVPALSLVAMFAFLVIFPLQPLQQGVEVNKSVKQIVASHAEKSYTTASKPSAAAADVTTPQVQVKRISSGVGTPMIFQKTYQDVPVTIVWVFPVGT